MSKKKNSFRINIEYVGLNTFIMFADLCPLRIAYFLARIIAMTIYICAGKHRKRAIQHLMHSGIVENEKEAKTLAWKNFMFFGRMGVDAFKVNKKITQENIHEYVKVIVSDEGRRVFFEENNALITLSPHMGNFMFVATAYAMLSGKDILSVIRPYDNPKIEKIIQKIQFKAGHKSCYKKGALKKLMAALRSNSSIGMLVDQHAGSTVGIDTTFFGQPCKTHSTPAVFHLKTGTPICVAALRQAKEPGKFELAMTEPIIIEPSDDKDADIKKITQMYTNAYETLIRDAPEQWFWAHRRWTNINRKKRQNTA
jgi:Kdo2-lipid IVA lauroyltransferase/acyltransferase